MENLQTDTMNLSEVIPHFIVVNKGSTQAKENGSHYFPFKTIQQAINNITSRSDIHKGEATILIQPGCQGYDEKDWTYQEDLTRPYKIWIKFKGSLQSSIDPIAPFDSFSTNRLIKIKGNISFNGGLNLFENLDLSDANLDMKDTSLDAIGCRIGNLTKSTDSPTAWCRLKDCRGSGLITMNNGYLILDNYINCLDDRSVNLLISGGSGVKIFNSSGINLETKESSVKPYVEATNTYFRGLNIANAEYVTLVGGGLTERSSSTVYSSYSVGGIRVVRGIPLSTTMFSYDPYKSIL